MGQRIKGVFKKINEKLDGRYAPIGNVIFGTASITRGVHGIITGNDVWMDDIIRGGMHYFVAAESYLQKDENINIAGFGGNAILAGINQFFRLTGDTSSKSFSYQMFPYETFIQACTNLVELYERRYREFKKYQADSKAE